MHGAGGLIFGCWIDTISDKKYLHVIISHYHMFGTLFAVKTHNLQPRYAHSQQTGYNVPAGLINQPR